MITVMRGVGAMQLLLVSPLLLLLGYLFVSAVRPW